MSECKERGLSTARAVLGVLSYIAESQRGVSAREVADRLQKSLSTAYHLLASLEAEGFVARVGRAGNYELVADKPGVPQTAPPAPDTVLPDKADTLRAGMREVFARTGRRTCVGVFSGDGVALIEDIGRQGLPRMGNLEKPLIRATAHALAVGKLLLAGFDDDVLGLWVAQHGLQPFTPSTIRDVTTLRTELSGVRRRGLATDCGEFDADFASLAAPVTDSVGRAVAAIVVTATRHQFGAEQDKLQLALLDVTRGISRAHAN